MKSKDSPNLYEILRSATRSPSVETAPAGPAGSDPRALEPHEPTLQERLAIYKAAKTGASTTQAAAPAPAASEPVAAASGPVAEAPAGPAPAPASVPKDPGQRVLRITYNTAAFLVLVLIGLHFLAYSLGVRAGRAETSPDRPAVAPAPTAVPAVAPPAAAPAPAPGPRPAFTLRLAEWPYRTPQERLKANAAADEAKKLLARAGLSGAETVQVLRGSEPRLALRLGRYPDPSSSQARSVLATVQKIRVQNQAPFAQAQFEEIPSR